VPAQLRRSGVRVSYPATHRLSRGMVSGDRDQGGFDPHRSLVGALRGNGFEVVDELRFSSKRARRQPDPAVAAGRLRLEVEPPGGQDAVVLVEQGGYYSWHLPGTAGQPRTSRLPGAAYRSAFDIDLVAARGAAWGVTPGRAGGAVRTRGRLDELLPGAVRAAVLRFPAPPPLSAAISLLERHVEPGLIHITHPDPRTWRRLERLDQVGLPGDRPARVLLLVHGTFSTTVSAFVALGLVGAGPQFLRKALAEYDAVIGFDHPTLSVDPLANATDLLRRVSGVTSGVTFDVITHSRGGLTTRSFVEFVLPGSGWRGSVDRVVFVAAPNAGTHLADPARWHDLVDLTTNLVMVTASSLARLPVATPAAGLVDGVIGGVATGIGALVKLLGSPLLDDRAVPGLAAMRPDGPFVTTLNRSQPGQPGPGTAWFVAKSDFRVSLRADGGGLPADFPREFARRLAEGFVDDIFRGPNDLVVDAASMGAIDASVGGFVRDTLDFGTNDVVHHLNYFHQPDLVAAMADWLLPSRARRRRTTRRGGPAHLAADPG
jgi:hypothetical protein